MSFKEIQEFTPLESHILKALGLVLALPIAPTGDGSPAARQPEHPGRLWSLFQSLQLRDRNSIHGPPPLCYRAITGSWRYRTESQLRRSLGGYCRKRFYSE